MTEKQIVTVKIKNHGSFSFQLEEEIAPIAIKRLLEVLEMKKFDGKRIERLEPDFVIQPLFFDGVDEEIDVMVEPEFKTNAANHARKFLRGTVAMAGDENHASGCQFFVTLKECERLNGNFTVIGEIVDGWDEIERIESLEVEERVDEPSGFTYHCPKKDQIVESVIASCSRPSEE